MRLKLHKKNTYSLACDHNKTLLTESVKASSSYGLRTIARTDGSLKDEKTLPRLLSTTSAPKADVSVALPLSFFEVVSLPLPVMPDEAINRALPYYLSKAIDKPLTSFVYDWQITQRQKNQLQLTVYLFPASTFRQFEEELTNKQLELAYFEADIFAAYAYLACTNQLQENETSICAIIWPEDISLAVYENKILTLVRSVSIPQPLIPFSPTIEEPISGELPHIDEEQPSMVNEPQADGLILFDEPGDDSILAEFDLFSLDKPAFTAEESTDVENNEPEIPADEQTVALSIQSWSDYLQNINLEIMRTRDYHASIIKGNAINKIYISGAEPFWKDLEEISKSSLGLEIQALGSASPNDEISSTLNTICLGTGIR